MKIFRGTRSYVAMAFLVTASWVFPAHATVTPGCIDPSSSQYGAIANDGRDDRAAFQAAIDDAIANKFDVCIPAGTFHLAHDPSPMSLWSVRIRGPVRVTGEGVEHTELAMLGSGIFAGRTNPANWRLIDIREGASDVYLGHMALDGSERYDTQEQTHLLNLNGPVARVTIEDVKTTLPPLIPPAGTTPCPKEQYASGLGAFCDASGALVGFFSGGDCVRFLGGKGALVQDVVVRHVNGPTCDRGVFTIQRGVSNLLIEDSQGDCHDDQALDVEPSGDVPIDNVTLRRVRLGRGDSDGTAFTAAIGGAVNTPAHNILLEDVEITGGSLHLINTSNITLTRVHVDSGVVSTTPTLYIRKRAVNIQINDSVFTRPLGAPYAPVVLAQHDGGVAPTDVTFTGGSLHQETTGAIVRVESLQNLTLDGTQLHYTRGVTSGPAIVSRSVLASTDAIALHSVRLSAAANSFDSLLLISADSGYTSGRGILTDVCATGLKTYGLLFLNGGGYPPTLPAIMINNKLEKPTTLCRGTGC